MLRLDFLSARVIDEFKKRIARESYFVTCNTVNKFAFGDNIYRAVSLVTGQIH